MKKIFLGVLLIIVAGYVVPVPAIRDPVNDLISGVTGQTGWLFKEKKCNTPLEERQKGYCAD